MKYWIPSALGAMLMPAAAFAADADTRIGATGSAEQDVQCAAWAGYIVGTNDDADVKQGFSLAMTYFLGLYEGKTGQNFADRMVATAQLLDSDPSLIDALTPVCLPRTQDIGHRLSEFGGGSSPQEQSEPADGDKD